MCQIRTLIVDDHSLVRDALETYLSHIPDIHLLPSVATRMDALGSVALLPPDIMLIDLNLPDGTGLELMETLRPDHPQIGMIVMSHQLLNKTQKQRLDALGSSSFLPKGVSGNDIVTAIQTLFLL